MLVCDSLTVASELDPVPSLAIECSFTERKKNKQLSRGRSANTCVPCMCPSPYVADGGGQGEGTSVGYVADGGGQGEGTSVG